MPDWRSLVERRLSRLPKSMREEVWRELSDHLEDTYEQLLASGIGENEATDRTAACISQWKQLGRDIVREREGTMSTFGKQFILPSGVALVLASVALAMETRFGPRPAVWHFGIYAFVIYKLWPIALLFTGGISAWLSVRAGAGRGRRSLVAVTPALYMLGAMVFVVAASLLMQLLGLMPEQPSVWKGLFFVVANWVALPAVALLVGAIPFVGWSENQIRHGLNG